MRFYPTAAPSEAKRLLYAICIVYHRLAACLFLGALVVAGQATEKGEDFYPRLETRHPKTGVTTNTGVFVYRDVNRNGRYDPADRPMVHVAVKLYRPDGSRVVRRSNIYGFVNFSTAPDSASADIGKGGEYRFEAILPDGWRATSANLVQTARFVMRPGTRPGIVADRLPSHVGLVQVLEITGRVAVRAENGDLIALPDATVTATFPSGDKHDVAVNEEGWFSFEVVPGLWSLEAAAPRFESTLERLVNVDHAPVRLSAMVFSDQEIPKAENEQVVDFDDITAVIAKMPDGPAGLKWTNLVVVENLLYRGAGYINNTVSGRYIGYSTSGYPVTIERQEGFDFFSAWFGTAWPQAEGEILDIRAWRGDELLGREQYELSALGPFRFDADYRNITRLEFSTRHYWQFVIDDPAFSFR